MAGIRPKFRTLEIRLALENVEMKSEVVISRLMWVKVLGLSVLPVYQDFTKL